MNKRQLPFRVGIGFDFHPFAEQRRLLLGGVEIPHPRGLAGHSDADVLLHAVSDGMLGAAGLADIGTHFLDSDEKYKDISSVLLLQRVLALVTDTGYETGNVDIVVIAEEPRLQPHVSAIRLNLANLLSIEVEAIGLKATTMEKKGVIGRREGIAVQAVVLLVRPEWGPL